MRRQNCTERHLQALSTNRRACSERAGLRVAAAMPTITSAIEAGRTIARQSLHEMPLANPRAVIRKPPARLGPERISVARLPITGSDVFGREEDIAFLDRAWANQHANVVILFE
jgi:hypothetical protein